MTQPGWRELDGEGEERWCVCSCTALPHATIIGMDFDDIVRDSRRIAVLYYSTAVVGASSSFKAGSHMRYSLYVYYSSTLGKNMLGKTGEESTYHTPPRVQKIWEVLFLNSRVDL